MALHPTMTFTGFLTDDPRCDFTKTGLSVCNFTLACTPTVFNRESEQWDQQETLFLRCTAWRDLAENITESLSKGDLVIAYGKLSCSVWEDEDGNKRSQFELTVSSAGADLSRHTATVKKMNRSKSDTRENTRSSGKAARNTPNDDEVEEAPRRTARARKTASARR